MQSISAKSKKQIPIKSLSGGVAVNNKPLPLFIMFCVWENTFFFLETDTDKFDIKDILQEKQSALRDPTLPFVCQNPAKDLL